MEEYFHSTLSTQHWSEKGRQPKKSGPALLANDASPTNRNALSCGFSLCLEQKAITIITIAIGYTPNYSDLPIYLLSNQINNTVYTV
jgi:hypothetical protein